MTASIWDPDGKVDRDLKRLIAHVAGRTAGCQYRMAHTAGGALHFGVAPQIHINQGTAQSTGVVGVEGKNKNGQALRFTIIETQVYEKRSDRWLMVSHHASRVPE
jgi:ketosteroid isomerase-like protein